jgi:hypothetical protein
VTLDAPPYLRTSLDDDAAHSSVAPGPRRIRSTLDDASHAAFPLDPVGRLIRVSLDDGTITYGRLGPPLPQVRRVRTSLD